MADKKDIKFTSSIDLKSFDKSIDRMQKDLNSIYDKIGKFTEKLNSPNELRLFKEANKEVKNLTKSFREQEKQVNKTIFSVKSLSEAQEHLKKGHLVSNDVTKGLAEVRKLDDKIGKYSKNLEKRKDNFRYRGDHYRKLEEYAKRAKVGASGEDVKSLINKRTGIKKSDYLKKLNKSLEWQEEITKKNFKVSKKKIDNFVDKLNKNKGVIINSPDKENVKSELNKSLEWQEELTKKKYRKSKKNVDRFIKKLNKTNTTNLSDTINQNLGVGKSSFFNKTAFNQNESFYRDMIKKSINKGSGENLRKIIERNTGLDKPISAKITADTTTFRARVKKASGTLDRFKRRVAIAGKKIKKSLNNAFGAGVVAGVTNFGLNAFMEGLQRIGEAIKEFIMSSSKISMAFDSIETKFRAASGSFEQGRESFKDVLSLSREYGVNLLETAEAFTLFQASALRSNISLKQSKKIYEDITQAVVSLQLGSERTGLIFRALEQIAAKQIVQLEELKLQLGDSLPGAVTIAARSMDMTTAAFRKAVSEGKIMANEFLPKFSQQIKEELGGSAEFAAGMARQEFEKLRTEITLLQDKSGDLINHFLVPLSKAFTPFIKQLTTVVEKLHLLNTAAKNLNYNDSITRKILLESDISKFEEAFGLRDEKGNLLRKKDGSVKLDKFKATSSNLSPLNMIKTANPIFGAAANQIGMGGVSYQIEDYYENLKKLENTKKQLKDLTKNDKLVGEEGSFDFDFDFSGTPGKIKNRLQRLNVRSEAYERLEKKKAELHKNGLKTRALSEKKYNRIVLKYLKDQLNSVKDLEKKTEKGIESAKNTYRAKVKGIIRDHAKEGYEPEELVERFESGKEWRSGLTPMASNNLKNQVEQYKSAIAEIKKYKKENLGDFGTDINSAIFKEVKFEDEKALKKKKEREEKERLKNAKRIRDALYSANNAAQRHNRSVTEKSIREQYRVNLKTLEMHKDKEVALVGLTEIQKLKIRKKHEQIKLNYIHSVRDKIKNANYELAKQEENLMKATTDLHREKLNQIGGLFKTVFSNILDTTGTFKERMANMFKEVLWYIAQIELKWAFGKLAGMGGGSGIAATIGKIAGTAMSLDTGGIIPGSFSQAVPITAHGSEMVLNPRQQNRLWNIINGNSQGASSKNITIVNSPNINTSASKDDVLAALRQSNDEFAGIISENIDGNISGLRSKIQEI